MGPVLLRLWPSCVCAFAPISGGRAAPAGFLGGLKCKVPQGDWLRVTTSLLLPQVMTTCAMSPMPCLAPRPSAVRRTGAVACSLGTPRPPLSSPRARGHPHGTGGQRLLGAQGSAGSTHAPGSSGRKVSVGRAGYGVMDGMGIGMGVWIGMGIGVELRVEQRMGMGMRWGTQPGIGMGMGTWMRMMISWDGVPAVPHPSLSPLAPRAGTCYQQAKQVLHAAVPDRLQGRERETGILRQFLREHVLGRRPGSLYVSGAPGTGKTACLSRVLLDCKVCAMATAVGLLLGPGGQRVGCNIPIPAGRAGREQDCGAELHGTGQPSERLPCPGTAPGAACGHWPGAYPEPGEASDSPGAHGVSSLSVVGGVGSPLDARRGSLAAALLSLLGVL